MGKQVLLFGGLAMATIGGLIAWRAKSDSLSVFGGFMCLFGLVAVSATRDQ